jgi:hypothetical protein
MACDFSIEFKGSPDQVLNKAKSAVQGQGGSFDGDVNGGSFKVSAFGNSIAGTYTVSGQQMHISITDKPFLLSCGMIESYLKSQLT